MSHKNRTTPRIVCCAIPIASGSTKVLMITSRSHPDKWILPKGGYETSDRTLEAAVEREAYEEAGVQGVVTKYLTTINGKTATYHFYELDAQSLAQDWLEKHQRRREWVDYADAVNRLAWKPELAQALMLSSLAPKR